MSLRDDIAAIVAANLGYEGITISEACALTVAARLEGFLWEHASPTVWDGMRGRTLFMARDGSEQTVP